jgi:hypothetical protein
MPRFAPVVLAVLAAATLVRADEAGSALDSLVQAEKAFSALSVSDGMKTAFLDNLADDGIIFRPGPINGRASWGERRSPPGTLIWEPSYVEVSALGDLGVSTGPWEYRPPTNGEVAYGHFVSIWVRDEKTPWKVAVDLGIAHPRAERGGVGAVEFRPGPEHPYHEGAPPQHSSKSVGLGMSIGGVGFGVGTGGGGPPDDPYRRNAWEVNRMMGAERTLVYELHGKGAGRAYPRVATEDVRVYRDDRQPVIGITEAIALNDPKPQNIEFVPFGKSVSGTWDFGYTYGLALRGSKGSSRDTSGYLHVWRHTGTDEWRLSLDVESAFPKR